MNNRELENKIRSSYQNIAPDILDSVLADCDAQKGRVIIMKEKKRHKSLIKYFGSLAAAMLLVIGGIGFYQSNYAIASTVMLDVNPGIGINVNKSEKVLDVKPYNDDARTVIGDMDFSGSNLDVTVNALIGSMLRNGYISEDANSILITVDSKDPAKGQEIQIRLMDEINGILAGENLSGAVLGQTVKDDAELEKLAEQYGITFGKAKLIDQIAKQNTLYSFKDLVSLTINELNLISASGNTKLENIEAIGTASSSAYIGEQKATDAAFQRAGVRAEDAAGLTCNLDWEKGIMVYEVEFNVGATEYEADIDAVTGEVVGFNQEKDDDFFDAPVIPEKSGQNLDAPMIPEKSGQNQDSSKTGSEVHYIGEAEAKAAAIQHAQVAESDVYEYSCETEYKHGIQIFEIEFTAGGMEYDYDINAETAEVIRYSKEKDDDFHERQTENTDQSAKKASSGQDAKQGASEQTSGSDIGREAAKSAALGHAGVSDIQDYECEQDFEHGKLVYEISFTSNGYEYEYEINAADGTILKHEKERD